MSIPLITSPDSFEVIGETIYNILKTEIANQVNLATLAGQPYDPEDYRLRVYYEQANKMDQLADDEIADKAPIVNLYYEDSTTDLEASTYTIGQNVNSIFIIDIGAVGQTKLVTGGHEAGEKNAALNAKRAARLVRNILMHAENKHLLIPTIVGRRYVQELNSFVPDQNKPANPIHGMSFRFAVDHKETITTQEYGAIEQIFIEHKFDPLGSNIAEQSFIYV